MKKNNLVAFLLFISFTASAIPTDSVFLNIPDKLLPLISKKNRYELSEYFKAGKSDSITNNFGKQAFMLKYDTATCHIILKTSATSTFELKRISDKNNETIYGIIKSISAPYLQSVVKFYDTNWNEISKQMKFPATESWYDLSKIKNDELDTVWLKRKINSEYFSLKFTTDNALEVENTLLQTLSVEDRKILEPIFAQKTIRIAL